MRARRKIFVRAVIVVAFIIAAVAVIMSRPQKVEGLYSAGNLITCMCDDCSHYLRFHNGYVIHYATNHEPANLFGRYEVDSDGQIVIYMVPLRGGDPEEVLFKINQPRAAFAIATTEEGHSSWLRRVSIRGEVSDLLAKQEVKQVTISDNTKMVTTFYDSSLVVLREEIKPLKKRQAE